MGVLPWCAPTTRSFSSLPTLKSTYTRMPRTARAPVTGAGDVAAVAVDQKPFTHDLLSDGAPSSASSYAG